MFRVGSKVTYVGETIKAISGMSGEIVSRSKFEERELATIHFPEIDRKYTVRLINLIGR